MKMVNKKRNVKAEALRGGGEDGAPKLGRKSASQVSWNKNGQGRTFSKKVSKKAAPSATTATSTTRPSNVTNSTSNPSGGSNSVRVRPVERPSRAGEIADNNVHGTGRRVHSPRPDNVGTQIPDSQKVNKAVTSGGKPVVSREHRPEDGIRTAATAAGGVAAVVGGAKAVQIGARVMAGGVKHQTGSSKVRKRMDPAKNKAATSKPQKAAKTKRVVRIGGSPGVGHVMSGGGGGGIFTQFRRRKGTTSPVGSVNILH